MPDQQKPRDAKREVQDTTKPASETNTKTERAPGVPAPQKGGLEPQKQS